MPDHGRDRDLFQAEAPRARKCQVVVEPAVHARANRLPEAVGHVLAELAGQHSPVDVGEQRLQRGGDIRGGDALELLALLAKIRPQLVFAVQRSGELGYVLLSHAGHPIETLCPVRGDASYHQHRPGGAEPGSAGQGMGTTAGPASYQAAFGADRRQDSLGVGSHVHDGAAWLAA